MQRLGSLDATFLAIEQPNCPMNIGSVAVFEGPAPDIDTVRAFIAAKLPSLPRCRERVRDSWRGHARPVWVEDTRFDLTDHVHTARLATADLRALDRFAEQVMMVPLDRQRALWEMWVVADVGDGRWAVVSKMHHCVVDGIAGTDLLAALLDDAPDLVHPPTPTSAPAEPGEPTELGLARFSAVMVLHSWRGHAAHLGAALAHPRATCARWREIAAGARALWLQPTRPTSPLTGPIGPQRRWAHTDVALGDVGVIRRALGGTVNDVVLAAISQGFGDLLRERGVSTTARDVMALVPVSMRGPAERGLFDNRVAVTHALLPIGLDDPIATLHAIHTHLAQVKASHQTDASTVLLHSGDMVPFALAARIARAVVRVQRNLETVATNVPGPRRPLYLCGSRMLAARPFAPIAGQIRIVVATWSYCGVLYVGVTGDRDGAGDIRVLVDGIDLGIRRLLDASRAIAS